MTETTNGVAATPKSKYAAKRDTRVNTSINLDKSSDESSDEMSMSKIDTLSAKFGAENVKIALLLKNNAEIRRFTSLAIINYLTQKNEIAGDKKYVSFKWDKFAVKYDNLMREYSYKENFFLTALVGSFASFANSAQKTIEEFLSANNLEVPKSE